MVVRNVFSVKCRDAEGDRFRCSGLRLDSDWVPQRSMVHARGAPLLGARVIAVLIGALSAMSRPNVVAFRAETGNRQLLFHASRFSSFYGIISRGLQLPSVVVDDLGGQRSDAGMLGAGIYFGDRPSTAAQYSDVGPGTGTRLMLVRQLRHYATLC